MELEALHAAMRHLFGQARRRRTIGPRRRGPHVHRGGTGRFGARAQRAMRAALNARRHKLRWLVDRAVGRWPDLSAILPVDIDCPLAGERAAPATSARSACQLSARSIPHNLSAQPARRGDRLAAGTGRSSGDPSAARASSKGPWRGSEPGGGADAATASRSTARSVHDACRDAIGPEAVRRGARRGGGDMVAGHRRRGTARAVTRARRRPRRSRAAAVGGTAGDGGEQPRSRPRDGRAASPSRLWRARHRNGH